MGEMTESERLFPLMGGMIGVTVYDAPAEEAEKHFRRIHAEALRLEKVFNLYDPESELSRLNAKRDACVSDELIETIRKALDYADETGGRYDVTLGRQFLARKRGEDGERPSCSYKDVTIRDSRVSLNHPDALLDLGSIAKGRVVDGLVAHMMELGVPGGFIDARGDMRIFGEHPEVVWVQDPRDRSRREKPFILENAAVATSGDYNQYRGSYDRSHIIGQQDFASVTVAAGTLMEADAAATCLFVLGTGGAAKFMDHHPRMRAYAIDRSLRGHVFNGFDELLVPEAILNG